MDLSQLKEAALKECMLATEQRQEPKPVETKTTVDSQEHQRLRAELAELQGLIQAKDRTIDFLSQRVEKVRSNTLPLITEDSINKSASLRSVLA